MTPPETRYSGERHVGPAGQVFGCIVTRGTRPFLPDASWKLYEHSQSGFEWGYLGSGPARLALALAFDVTGDGSRAMAVYQDLKRAVVSQWGDIWEITAGEILSWICRLESERDARCRPAGYDTA